MRNPRRCAFVPLLHTVPGAPDPVEPAVLAAHEASRRRYGACKIKAALSRDGITASRRRICRIMQKNGLTSAYGRKRFKYHPRRPNEADLPNVIAGEFGGHAPCTHVCSDLTYVRVDERPEPRPHVRPLVDLSNREIVGHSAGPRQRVRQRKDRRDARRLRHRAVAVGEGVPVRQRGRRASQQDTEGRARLPRGVRHDARAAGQADGLCALVQQLQDAFDAGVHGSGRVQESRLGPPEDRPKRCSQSIFVTWRLEHAVPGPIHKDSTHDAVRHGCCLGCHARMLHVFLLFPLALNIRSCNALRYTVYFLDYPNLCSYQTSDTQMVLRRDYFKFISGRPGTILLAFAYAIAFPTEVVRALFGISCHQCSIVLR